MFNTTEKRERSLGIRLGLKAHRCDSVKCVGVRNTNPPGAHGKAFRRAASEFGTQLKEKQKMKAMYGVREAAMRKVFGAALRDAHATGHTMMVLLERRLDNVVYRLGLAPSRSVARQLVGHGHIVVNNRRTTIPSCLVRVGDKVSVRESSKTMSMFSTLAEKLKKYETPVWLALAGDKWEGEVRQLPKDFDMPFDVNMIVDFYSKMS